MKVSSQKHGNYTHARLPFSLPTFPSSQLAGRSKSDLSLLPLASAEAGIFHTASTACLTLQLGCQKSWGLLAPRPYNTDIELQQEMF